MGSSQDHSGSNGANGHRNGHSTTVAWAPTQASEHVDRDEHGIDLQQIGTALIGAKFRIALIAVVVFAAVMVHTALTQMDFRVHGSLYLGELQTRGDILDRLSAQFSMGDEKGDVGTQIEILRSRSRVTQAVLASGLNTRLYVSGWSPPRYWKWRLAGRDVRTLEGAWAEIRAVSTRLTGLNTARRSLTIAFVSASDYELLEKGKIIGKGTLGNLVVLPGLEIKLVPGEDRSPLPGSRYVLEVVPMEDIVEDVSRNLSASAPKEGGFGASTADVIHLQFTTLSPFQARVFLEQLMLGYLEQNLSWKTEEAAAAEAFLTKQVEAIRASLDKAGKDLAEFKKSSTTIELSEEAKSMIGQMGTLEQQRVAARLEVESLQQIKAVLVKGNVPTEAYLVGEAQDTVLMAMGQNLVKTQQEYKSLSEQFTPDYPPLKEAKASLDAQLKAVQSYVNNRLRRAQERLTSLDDAVDRYTGKLKELPDAELKLVTLTQEVEVYSKLYQFLLERQQQAALTKASTISKSRILDAPTLPTREASPKLMFRATLGLILGLFLGIAYILARWRLATTFQSEAEVRKTLGGIPLFASVPRQGENDSKSDAPVSPLQALSDPRSPFAEAFRLLRTNLYYSGSRDSDRILLVSSPGPGDGKTMTTLCLAGILAADGKKVLVIDADMRKPSHHIILRQPQHPGLSGILTNETHWRDTVHTVKSTFGDYSSISTGIVPPNPAELLSSPTLGTFLTEAKSVFDFILIDSPPFPLVSDALVLSQQADRHLSVVRIRKSHRRVAEEHVRRFSGATTRYGLVINDVSFGSGYGAYGYGYGYGYGVSSPAKLSRWRKWKRRRSDEQIRD